MSYDRQALKELYDKYGVPFVPEYDELARPVHAKKKGRRILLTFLILIPLLIGYFLGRFTGTTTTINHTTINQFPINLETSLICPDVRPFSDGPATLDFCSPVYHGDVAGPVGSHIT